MPDCPSAGLSLRRLGIITVVCYKSQPRHPRLCPSPRLARTNACPRRQQANPKRLWPIPNAYDTEHLGCQVRCRPRQGDGRRRAHPQLQRRRLDEPDVDLYVHALRPRIVGQTIRAIRLSTPFLLRSVEPPLASADGRRVVGVSRLGKRIVIALEADLFLVVHLMVAGRLQWDSKRKGLAVFEFDTGKLTLTEAGTKRRASLHLVQGEAALAAMDPGGIDVFNAPFQTFRSKLQSENHTVKRALTETIGCPVK